MKLNKFIFKKRHIILVIVITLVFITAIVIEFIDWKKQNQYTGLDAFAICLKSKGLIFYGGSWCQHCKNQKEMFGQSSEYLPYVECSEPYGQRELQNCKDLGVNAYPTWIFPDKTKHEGEMSIKDLASKSGCKLP